MSTKPTDPTPSDSELENRLRAVMRRHDHEAPGPAALDLHWPERGGAGARRRTAVLVGAAAAVVAATVVSALVTGHAHRTGQAAGPTPSSSASATSPSSTPSRTDPPVAFPSSSPYSAPPRSYGNGYTPGKITLGTDFTTVQWRGLRLAYPQSGDAACTDLTGVYYLGPTDNFWNNGDNCAGLDDPKNPVLVFAGLDSAHPMDVSPAIEHATIDGVAVLVGRRGDYAYIVVPSLKVAARFDSGSEGQTERTFASAAIVTKDARGCPLSVDPSKDPHSDVPGTDQQLVPGHPITAVVCDYDGADLRSFPADVTDPRATPERQQSGLNALRRSTTDCPVYTDRDSHLFLTYADGSVLDVRLRRTKCNAGENYNTADVVYSNGPLTRIGTEQTIIQPI